MVELKNGHGLLEKLGDFTAEPRVLGITAMGLVAGTGGVAAGWALLHLISLVNALAYLGVLSAASNPPRHLPFWTVLVPVLGAVAIGLMARYGSERYSRPWNSGGVGGHHSRRLEDGAEGRDF